MPPAGEGHKKKEPSPAGGADSSGSFCTFHSRRRARHGLGNTSSYRKTLFCACSKGTGHDGCSRVAASHHESCRWRRDARIWPRSGRSPESCPWTGSNQKRQDRRWYRNDIEWLRPERTAGLPTPLPRIQYPIFPCAYFLPTLFRFLEKNTITTLVWHTLGKRQSNSPALLFLPTRFLPPLDRRARLL